MVFLIFRSASLRSVSDSIQFATMNAQRMKLFVGVGVSFVTAIFSYTIYRFLTKGSAKRNRERSEIKDPHFCEEEIAEISPPIEFSSKIGPRYDLDSSDVDTAGVDTSLDSDVVGHLLHPEDRCEVVETMVVPSSQDVVTSVPMINLDDTVSLHSSDLSNGSFIDLLEDSDILEAHVVNDVNGMTRRHLEDCVELMSNILDANATELAPDHDQPLLESKVILTAESPVSDLNCSATLPPIAEISSVDVSSALEELEKTVGVLEESALKPVIVDEIVEPVIAAEFANANYVNNSPRVSNVTTDSGIGMTTSASADHFPVEARSAESHNPVVDASHQTDVSSSPEVGTICVSNRLLTIIMMAQPGAYQSFFLPFCNSLFVSSTTGYSL